MTHTVLWERDVTRLAIERKRQFDELNGLDVCALIEPVEMLYYKRRDDDSQYDAAHGTRT